MKWFKEPEHKKEDQVMDTRETEKTVKNVLDQVKAEGDAAVKELTRKYDGFDLEKISVEKDKIKAAYDYVDDESLTAIKDAAKQIETFAKNQLSALKPMEFESMPGVTLGHRLVPISRVGCYIPAGRYPLPSSALMSIVPAKVAGVKKIMACAPPLKDSSTLGGEFEIHPMILVAMDIAGADEVYCMGGAQAIAAYSYGTETVTKADMIVGPGNRFVTEAKRQVNGMVGIDLLAGPSEVLIIADDSADSDKVAMDLLAKCEHDADAVSILVTTSESMAKETIKKLEEKLEKLETKEVAEESWEKYGEVVTCNDMNEAVTLANERAPEHLQLMLDDPEPLVPQLENYGSLFIGHESPVAFGDYCSGTNHILPTNQSGRHTNGLWVGSFIKVLSHQKVSSKGAKKLSKTCSHLAEREGLYAHKHSSDLRGKEG